MTIEEVLQRLDEIGWLAQLSASKRKRLKGNLEEWRSRNPAWTYLGLATSSYDIEAIENEGDYADLVRTYVRASNRVFDAKDIESRLDAGQEAAFVAFTLGGQRHERRFSMEAADYVSEEFEPFLNQCLEKAGIEQRFFTLPMVDQVAHVVFVPPSVHAAAEAAGLLGDQQPPVARSSASVRPRSSAPRPKGRERYVPLPASPRAYVLASVTGAMLASVAGATQALPLPSLAGLVAFGAAILVMSSILVQHPSGRLWILQVALFTLTVANAGMLVENVERGAARWALPQIAAAVLLVWLGARLGAGGPMAAQRRMRSIQKYCAREGIEVPEAFGRHPGQRFVVVRTNSLPLRLSTAALFDEADLQRYLQARVPELGVSDKSTLPLRVLDFEVGHELAVDSTGRTRPVRRLRLPLTY